MSDYRVFNDNGYERTWEELYEDNVSFQKYTDKLEKENQELKKQLENKYEKVGTLTSELLYEENTKLINQQKKFIKYLEDEINKLKEQIKNYDIWHEVGTDINFLILKKQFNIEILSKYKEIIGE